MSGKGAKGKGVKRQRSTDQNEAGKTSGAFAGAVAKTLGKQLPAKVSAEIAWSLFFCYTEFNSAEPHHGEAPHKQHEV